MTGADPDGPGGEALGLTGRNRHKSNRSRTISRLRRRGLQVDISSTSALTAAKRPIDTWATWRAGRLCFLYSGTSPCSSILL